MYCLGPILLAIGLVGAFNWLASGIRGHQKEDIEAHKGGSRGEAWSGELLASRRTYRHIWQILSQTLVLLQVALEAAIPCFSAAFNGAFVTRRTF